MYYPGFGSAYAGRPCLVSRERQQVVVGEARKRLTRRAVAQHGVIEYVDSRREADLGPVGTEGWDKPDSDIHSKGRKRRWGLNLFRVVRYVAKCMQGAA